VHLSLARFRALSRSHRRTAISSGPLIVDKVDDVRDAAALDVVVVAQQERRLGVDGATHVDLVREARDARDLLHPVSELLTVQHTSQLGDRLIVHGLQVVGLEEREQVGGLVVEVLQRLIDMSGSGARTSTATIAVTCTQRT